MRIRVKARVRARVRVRVSGGWSEVGVAALAVGVHPPPLLSLVLTHVLLAHLVGALGHWALGTGHWRHGAFGIEGN